MTLPSFPVDPTTLDLVLAACDGTGQGFYALLDVIAELGGSDPTAWLEESDDVRVLRDPMYVAEDVIAALITEVRRLRGEST